jgi:hypothetical protein
VVAASLNAEQAFKVFRGFGGALRRSAHNRGYLTPFGGVPLSVVLTYACRANNSRFQRTGHALLRFLKIALRFIFPQLRHFIL